MAYTYRLLYVGITEGKTAECPALKENTVKLKITTVTAFFSLLSRPLDPFLWYVPNSVIKCTFLSLALSFPQTKTHRALLDPQVLVVLECWGNSSIKTFFSWFFRMGWSALGQLLRLYSIISHRTIWNSMVQWS